MLEGLGFRVEARDSKNCPNVAPDLGILGCSSGSPERVLSMERKPLTTKPLNPKPLQGPELMVKDLSTWRVRGTK